MASTDPGPSSDRAPVCAIGPDLWYRREPDGSVVIGLTEEAARRAGRIARFRGPIEGRRYAAAEPAASIESEKWVGHLAVPVDGTVLAINTGAEADPSLIGRDPLGAGWLYRLRPSDPGSLAPLAERAKEPVGERER